MEISQRKKKILAAVVDEYIRTAEPVGSKTIASMPGMDFSPVAELCASLAGVIVYFLLDQLNFIASISAVVGAYAAVFGYGLFTKRKNSKTGIIVASVVTVIMMVLAVYLCTVYDLYSQVRADGGTITLSTAAGDCRTGSRRADREERSPSAARRAGKQWYWVRCSK